VVSFGDSLSTEGVAGMGTRVLLLAIRVAAMPIFY